MRLHIVSLRNMMKYKPCIEAKQVRATDFAVQQGKKMTFDEITRWQWGVLTVYDVRAMVNVEIAIKLVNFRCV